VNDSSGTTVRLVGEPLRFDSGSMQGSISADVEYLATVPLGTSIDASTSSGDIQVRGPLGACRLRTDYGDVDAADTQGGLEAHTSSGEVHAARAEGGALLLESSYGDVHLTSATAERIALSSSSGDIDIEDARAQSVELSTSYGSVSARRITGELHARSGSGDLPLSGIEGALEAASSYGDVAVEGVFAELRASASSGDVRARALAGSRADRPWSLSSSYGGVTLSVPEDFGCDLDARTSYGSVESDFPILTEAGKRAGDSSLRGRLGAGGASVSLSAGSGDVALKKL